MEFRFGFGLGALGGFGSEEDVLADAFETDAVGLFGAAFPIAVGAIEEVDAEVVHAADVCSRGFDGGVQIHARATLGDDGDLRSGLAVFLHGDAARFGFAGLRVGRGAHRRADEDSAFHGP